jgi:hypothetical protein
VREARWVHQDRACERADAEAARLLLGRIRRFGGLGLRLCARRGRLGLLRLPERGQVDVLVGRDCSIRATSFVRVAKVLGPAGLSAIRLCRASSSLVGISSSFMAFSYVLVGT